MTSHIFEVTTLVGNIREYSVLQVSNDGKANLIYNRGRNIADIADAYTLHESDILVSQAFDAFNAYKSVGLDDDIHLTSNRKGIRMIWEPKPYPQHLGPSLDISPIDGKLFLLKYDPQKSSRPLKQLCLLHDSFGGLVLQFEGLRVSLKTVPHEAEYEQHYGVKDLRTDSRK